MMIYKKPAKLAFSDFPIARNAMMKHALNTMDVLKGLIDRSIPKNVLEFVKMIKKVEIFFFIFKIF